MIMKTTAAVLALAASASLTATQTADAFTRDHQFEVDFVYSAKAPVADTYRNFQLTARKACADEIGRVDRLYTFKERQACTDELLTKAVAKTELPALIALHSGQADRLPSTPEHAAR